MTVLMIAGFRFFFLIYIFHTIVTRICEGEGTGVNTDNCPVVKLAPRDSSQMLNLISP